jgi:23S rRNA (cytosine1962-C5)-methyltransferase
MITTLLKRTGKLKCQAGHPWIFATDITNNSLLPKRAGAIFVDEHWWLHSPKSFIRLRRLGPSLKNWMKPSKFQILSSADQFQGFLGEWLEAHLTQVLESKVKSLNFSSEEDLCFRWIFSEHDFLPGLIIDVFGSTIVCQINSAPIEIFWFSFRKNIETVFKKFLAQYPPTNAPTPNKDAQFQILELRNSTVRKKEGLDIIAFEQPKTPASANILNWNGLLWNLTPAGSQKTGAYFDQRVNHTRAAQVAKENNFKSAWDLCTFQGGFALHLIKAGLNVVALDQSEESLQFVKSNLELNNLPSTKLELVHSDVFKWLQTKSAELNKPAAALNMPVGAGEPNNSASTNQTPETDKPSKPDMIILDPPSFVKSRDAIAPALKGYRELNTLALKCLKPGGILISCVCSHHISQPDYKKTLITAAKDAQVTIEILEILGPSPDHLPNSEYNFPEGNYLQAWYVRVNS